MLRGCRSDEEKLIACRDTANYKLQILGITETHVVEEALEKTSIKINNEIKDYIIYHSGIKDSTNIYIAESE